MPVASFWSVRGGEGIARMTNALFILTYPEKLRNRYADGLRKEFPDININVVDHHSKVDPYIGTADVLLTFGTMMADHVAAAAPNLKWIQALGTGTDGILDLQSLRPEVIVTNIRGIQGAAMSEAALTAMLALSRDLARSVRCQELQSWERWPATLLHGKTVGILGVGAIAEALAPRCKAMGMTVVGISSVPREVPGFDRIRRRSELSEAIGEFDYLVVLIPLSAETRNIVDAEALAAMKSSSYLINLARGGVIDEVALIRALEQGKIAGAALDVFCQEPLSKEHPLWSVKNLIITAHLGGFYDRYVDDALPAVAENMHRFLAGNMKNMRGLVREI
jgi:phosphoglycerate dehydrogenase-like enzyme